jgi:nicotinic acid mononucleotide adenylyltransferase
MDLGITATAETTATTATTDIPQVLPKEIDARGYEGPIVFSYQGAFGPPTYGHYVAMKLMALQVCKDYPKASQITMLFMPTPGGSKKHLNPTRDIRIKVLNKFCELLAFEPEITEINDKRTRLVFEPSRIEYNKADAVDKSISTISTIEELEKIETKPLILIGMGYDNMLQLPYWERVKDYHKKVARIYVVYRTLSDDEQGKTKLFRIVGPGKGGDGQDYPVLSFETIVPSWSKDLTSITVGFDIGPEVETTKTNPVAESAKIEEYNKRMAGKFTESAEIYNYKLELPTIVTIGRVEVVDEHGNVSYKSAIPPTSSSMLRYFILKNSTFTDSGWEGPESPKNKNIQKIQNIIFGPNGNISTDQIKGFEQQKLKIYDEIVSVTLNIINEFKNYNFEHNTENSNVAMITLSDTEKTRKYEEEYNKLLEIENMGLEPTSIETTGGTKKKRRKPRKSAKKGRRTGKKHASNRRRNKQTLRKYR